MYNYIEIFGPEGGYTTEEGQVVLVQSNEPLTINENRIQLSDEEMTNKYQLHIKYIDCCYLSEGKLEIDRLKVLARKMEKLRFDGRQKNIQLRSLILEASTFGKTDICLEIKDIMSTINEFMNSDFSHIEDLNDIHNLTCPELNIDYASYYINKIY